MQNTQENIDEIAKSMDIDLLSPYIKLIQVHKAKQQRRSPFYRL